MSLINKMLQDLDARGSQGADTAQSDIRPVGRGERAVPAPVVMGALAGVLILAVGGVYGWRVLHQAPIVQGPVADVAPAVAPAVAPPVTAAAPAVPQASATAPAASVPATAVAAAPTPVAMTAAPVEAGSASVAPAAKTPAQPEQAQAAASARDRADSRSVPEKREQEMARLKQADASLAAAPRHDKPVRPSARQPIVADLPQTGRQAPTGQGAESVYRRSLISLQDGRVSDAVVQLEQALAADPRHEAARQTLVGIHVEQGRTAEAMRLLQAGLALDARQPAMAMLLARMQIDGGGSGVETLMASLPAAGANAEYRAFLAGALQRERRHQEAVEQYQAALRSAPENGVWWMGLGLSLEAGKRLPEALAAFERARATGSLSPELQGFVERKVGALGR